MQQQQQTRGRPQRQQRRETAKTRPSNADRPSRQQNDATSGRPRRVHATSNERGRVLALGEEFQPAANSEFEVYVQGLPYRVKTEDVREFFDQCGEVESVTLPRFHDTGKPHGFCFVEFRTLRGVAAACELKNPELFGRPISVRRNLGRNFPAGRGNKTHDKRLAKKPEDCRTIFVGNLPFSMTEAQLWTLFQMCGKVVQVRMAKQPWTGKSRGFAHVEFEEAGAADRANALPDIVFHGRTLRIDYAESYDPFYKARDVDSVASDRQPDKNTTKGPIWRPTQPQALQRRAAADRAESPPQKRTDGDSPRVAHIDPQTEGVWRGPGAPPREQRPEPDVLVDEQAAPLDAFHMGTGSDLRPFGPGQTAALPVHTLPMMPPAVGVVPAPFDVPLGLAPSAGAVNCPTALSLPAAPPVSAAPSAMTTSATAAAWQMPAGSVAWAPSQPVFAYHQHHHFTMQPAQQFSLQQPAFEPQVAHAVSAVVPPVAFAAPGVSPALGLASVPTVDPAVSMPFMDLAPVAAPSMAATAVEGLAWTAATTMTTPAPPSSINLATLTPPGQLLQLATPANLAPKYSPPVVASNWGGHSGLDVITEEPEAPRAQPGAMW